MRGVMSRKLALAEMRQRNDLEILPHARLVVGTVPGLDLVLELVAIGCMTAVRSNP